MHCDLASEKGEGGTFGFADIRGREQTQGTLQERRENMKVKMTVSKLLACAMVVTSVFTGDITTANAEAGAKILEPLAKYDFEEAVSGDNGKYQDIQMVTRDFENYAGALDFMPGRDGAGKALSTDGIINEEITKKGEGKYGMKLPQKNLGEEYTVSAWFRSSWGTLNSKNDNPPKTFAVMSVGKSAEENVTIKPDAGSNGRVLFLYSGSTKAEGDMNNGGDNNFWMNWHMFTITQSGNQVTCYLDGDKKLETTAVPLMNDSAGSICLGVSQGGGGYATGEYDDISVYNAALDADQVGDLFAKGYAQEGKTPEEILQGVAEIDVTKNLTLDPGSKETIKLNLPDKLKAEDCTVSFAVEGTSDVVSVDAATGEVTANKMGTAQVVTSVKVGNTTKIGVTAVEVSAGFQGERDPFSKITEECYDKNLTIEPTKTASVFRLPDTLKLNEDVIVSYVSSNEDIAKVDENGLVTAQKKVGYARITTTVKAVYDGFEMEYQTLVKVSYDITKAKVSANTVYLEKGKTANITVKPTAAMNAAGCTIKYTASGAVSMDKGKVRAKKPGTGTVAVKVSSAGKSITKRITFYVGEISGKGSVKVKKSATLSVKGISGNVTWSLDKKGKKLASLSKNGKLTAKKKGTVKVTAKVKVGKKQVVTLSKNIKITK